MKNYKENLIKNNIYSLKLSQQEKLIKNIAWNTSN